MLHKAERAVQQGFFRDMMRPVRASAAIGIDEELCDGLPPISHVGSEFVSVPTTTRRSSWQRVPEKRMQRDEPAVARGGRQRGPQYSPRAALGRGGEGAVYETDFNAEVVAKVYHSALRPEKADKIRIMASLRNERLARLTAWPIDLLSLAGSRKPIGVLMPKISGRKDIHYLYSPKSRRGEFQRADWQFLTHAAANTARAFHVVHEADCVIGDVNHGGMLVGQDATVRLIDCDSFQITTQACRFLCEVGVETFTPPELQGKSFKGVVRTDNHDNFGLAVLIFLMLFMGRHPFAGRFLAPGEMPIARAIKECRFAYGARRANVQMESRRERPPCRRRRRCRLPV